MSGDIRAEFEPLPDITVFELAQMLKNGVGNSYGEVLFFPSQWETLAPELKRHFVRKDAP